MPNIFFIPSIKINLQSGPRTVPEDIEIDRDIAESDTWTDAQYFPQLGDIVMYCPQGHAELLQQFTENSS